MRSTCAVYIDAGYLLASAATRVTGTSLRSGIHVEYASLISSLIEAAEARCGLPVLRVHWYDSARDGVPDKPQERIGELPKVKLRLGRFGVDGQQKGVDLKIGLDLVAHARNGASDVFFLVSGDDDLTEAVEEAQSQGVQVVLLAVPNAEGKPHGVNRHLIRAADEIETIDGHIIDAATVKVEVPRPVPTPLAEPQIPDVAPARTAPTPLDLAARKASTQPAAPTRLAYSGTTDGISIVAPGYGDTDEQDHTIDEVVARVLASFKKSATPEAQIHLSRARPSVPREIDRALLLDASDALEVYDLDERVRFRLRERFWDAFDAS